jgi:hypothetical protein
MWTACGHTPAMKARDMLPYYGTAIPSTCGLGSMISAGGAVRAAPTRLQTFITAGGDRRYAEPLKEQRPCPPPTEKGPYSAGMPVHVALILQTRATARRARNGLITPAPPISCCRARKCSGSRYHSKEAYLWPSSPGCVHKLSTAPGLLRAVTQAHRSGAKPGDRVVVTGTIGDAALGLLLRRDAAIARRWELDPRQQDHLRTRYLIPEPRTAVAEILRKYATAAMDVSEPAHSTKRLWWSGRDPSTCRPRSCSPGHRRPPGERAASAGNLGRRRLRCHL